MRANARGTAPFLAALVLLAPPGCADQPAGTSSVAVGLRAGGSAGDRHCRVPAPEPIAFVDLPGRPFGVVPAPDGCSVLVAVNPGGSTPANGVALLRRYDGRMGIERVIDLPERPAGMVLTHDGQLLLAAVPAGVLVLDVARVLDGATDPVVGRVPGGPGSIQVNVTPDDSLLFVSDEGGGTITVVDLRRARDTGYGADSILGRVPVGVAPIALAISPDGRWLYNTSQRAAADWGWPIACKREGSADPGLVAPAGAVVVVDVDRARIDPAGAVVSRVPAGCSPVRAALAPDGEVLWVTARNSDALLAFDAGRLGRRPDRALLGSVPVGRSPVGVALFRRGRRVVVANSNRFADDPLQPQTLTVVDATRLEDGLEAVMATVPAGAFPRELAVSPDGRTLFVANYLSSSLEVVDLRPFFGREDGDEDADAAGGQRSGRRRPSSLPRARRGDRGDHRDAGNAGWLSRGPPQPSRGVSRRDLRDSRGSSIPTCSR